MSRKRGGDPPGPDEAQAETRALATPTDADNSPATNPPKGPFGDVRSPHPGPVKEIPPAPLRLGYQLFDENTGRWLPVPDVPPPAKFFGYFQYDGYWIHYDPLGIGTGGARPGEYLFLGFRAGYDHPPDRIPPYGWNPPPKPKAKGKPTA